MDYAASDLTPRERYKVLTSFILPRPIAWVTSVGPTGIVNAAPFSFFTAISANPPVICFSPMRNSRGATKDTLRNIQATGEFVVNIVSEDFAAQMNICSAEFPPEVDEFAASGLTPSSAANRNPPDSRQRRGTQSSRA